MAGIIVYDFFESQFGECLIARSGKGVCFLDFVIDTRDESRCRLAIAHAGETLCRRPGGLDHLADMAFDPAGAAKLEVDLRGTDFRSRSGMCYGRSNPARRQPMPGSRAGSAVPTPCEPSRAQSPAIGSPALSRVTA